MVTPVGLVSCINWGKTSFQRGSSGSKKESVEKVGLEFERKDELAVPAQIGVGNLLSRLRAKSEFS